MTKRAFSLLSTVLALTASACTKPPFGPASGHARFNEGPGTLGTGNFAPPPLHTNATSPDAASNENGGSLGGGGRSGPTAAGSTVPSTGGAALGSENGTLGSGYSVAPASSGGAVSGTESGPLGGSGN